MRDLIRAQKEILKKRYLESTMMIRVLIFWRQQIDGGYIVIKTSMDIFCDICGDWQGFLLSNKITVRRQAKKKGWHRIKVNGCLVDVCGRCNENFNVSEMEDIIIV